MSYIQRNSIRPQYVNEIMSSKRRERLRLRQRERERKRERERERERKNLFPPHPHHHSFEFHDDATGKTFTSPVRQKFFGSTLDIVIKYFFF